MIKNLSELLTKNKIQSWWYQQHCFISRPGSYLKRWLNSQNFTVKFYWLYSSGIISEIVLAAQNKRQKFCVRTKRQKSPKGLKVEYLQNEYVIYHLWSFHFRRKWLTSTTTLKSCQTTLTSNSPPHFTTTLYMKMSRRPTVLTHFSIFDVNYNSKFLGVDVNGRCSFIFGASYRHQKFSANFFWV